ncbi:MAG: alpha-amylase family glycosyl hydrolase [bacterium]
MTVGNSAGYHGYWALDFERIDPHLYSQDPSLAEGSKEYLKRLIDKLHKANIKVILDMVVNHTGYHNQAYHDYPYKKIQDTWFNPARAEWDEIESPLAGLPDLNHDLPEVADYFVNNIVDWIEQTGIDGIRMDKRDNPL